MTAVAETAKQARKQRSFLKRMLDHWAVKLTIIIITVVWLIPTAGLLITSFRPVSDIQRTGWWTIFVRRN